MYTDLMGTACLQAALYIGCISETFQHLIMGDCIFSIFVVDRHFFPVNGMTADRCPRSVPSSSFRLPATIARYRRLMECSFSCPGQISVCGVIFAYKKCSGGIFVDAVDNARTHNTIDSGKIIPAVVHDSIYQCSASMSGYWDVPPFPWVC